MSESGLLSDAIGLSRYWERYPGDRNDDHGINFRWDEEHSYPAQKRLAAQVEGATFDGSKEGRGVPFIDVVVSRTADGRRVFIKSVYTDAANAPTARINAHKVEWPLSCFPS